MVLSVDRAEREAGDGLDSRLTGEKRREAGVSCHDRLGGLLATPGFKCLTCGEMA